MRKEHRGAPLCVIKKQILEDFKEWCAERKAEESNRNLIEFLIQENLIQGPVFLDYIDKIQAPMFIRFSDIACEALREGFIPPRTWIGMRKGRKTK